MKSIWIQMGMPITLEIADAKVTDQDINIVKDYFTYVDEKFSTYKQTSEITQINQKLRNPSEYSNDMKLIFQLSEQTKHSTNGYFDIVHNGYIDPSGIVKGWAIFNASSLLKQHGFNDFYIDAGGDIEVSGVNFKKPWSVGIKNPFNSNEIIKVLELNNKGIATSGTYNRGTHIYNPLTQEKASNEIVSMTVIGPNVYEADRFATAAFAMGKDGIAFIETLQEFEGYMIDQNGIATMTTQFDQYVV